MVLRVAVTADVHLGERRFRRRVDTMNNMFKVLNHRSLEWFVQWAQDYDATLVAGDLFDTPNPDVEALVVAQKLHQLHDVHVLGGNHEWGPMNEANGVHPFDVLRSLDALQLEKERVQYHLQPESVQLAEHVCVHYLPYGHMNAETWSALREARVKNAWNVLVMHGTVGLNPRGVEGQDLYTLPKSVASLFDLVVSGHVHLPTVVEKRDLATENSFHVKAGKTFVLTPGSLSPSAAALTLPHPEEANPKVWVLDFPDSYGPDQKLTIQWQELPTAPHVHVLHVDDVNEALQQVVDDDHGVPGVWHVAFSGTIKDIDMVLYKKALLNCLNLSVQPSQVVEMERKVQVMPTGFWDWVKDEHPDWYDEFMTVKKM